MSKKKLYVVRVQIGGCLSIPVHAEDEDGALEAFYKAFDESAGILDPGHELEWEFDEGHNREFVEIEDQTT